MVAAEVVAGIMPGGPLRVEHEREVGGGVPRDRVAHPGGVERGRNQGEAHLFRIGSKISAFGAGDAVSPFYVWGVKISGSNQRVVSGFVPGLLQQSFETLRSVVRATVRVEC